MESEIRQEIVRDTKGNRERLYVTSSYAARLNGLPAVHCVLHSEREKDGRESEIKERLRKRKVSKFSKILYS